jgi:hypothetical protein
MLVPLEQSLVISLSLWITRFKKIKVKDLGVILNFIQGPSSFWQNSNESRWFSKNPIKSTGAPL